MSRTEHHSCGHPLARLVHAEDLGNDIAQGVGAVIGAEQRSLRHRVAQHNGSDRAALGMVGIQPGGCLAMS